MVDDGGGADVADVGVGTGETQAADGAEAANGTETADDNDMAAACPAVATAVVASAVLLCSSDLAWPLIEFVVGQLLPTTYNLRVSLL